MRGGKLFDAEPFVAFPADAGDAAVKEVQRARKALFTPPCVATYYRDLAEGGRKQLRHQVAVPVRPGAQHYGRNGDFLPAAKGLGIVV